MVTAHADEDYGDDDDDNDDDDDGDETDDDGDELLFVMLYSSIHMLHHLIDYQS